MKCIVTTFISIFLFSFYSSSYAYSCSDMNNVIVPSLSTYISQSSSNVLNLKNALVTADNTGKNICIPNGTYYLNSTVSYETGNTVDITLEPNATLKATSQLRYVMLSLRGMRNNSTEYHRGSFKIKGGSLDVSSVRQSNIQNAGTALGISWARTIDIRDVNFIAGDANIRNGDVGAGIVNSNIVHIQNSKFTGFSDAAIYIGGDNYPYDATNNNQYHSRGHFRNNSFLNNGLSITVKRRLPYVEIRDNHFKNSDTDVHEGETSDNHPGSKLYVIGNKTENFTQRFVLLTHSRSAIIRDNLILIRPNHQSDSLNKPNLAIIQMRGGSNDINSNSPKGDWVHGNKIYDWRNRGSQALEFVKSNPFTSCIDTDFTSNINYHHYYEDNNPNINLTRNTLMTGNTMVNMNGPTYSNVTLYQQCRPVR